MNHYITAGYLDLLLVAQGKVGITGELDPRIVHELLSSHASRDDHGRYTIAGHQLFYAGGYIVCPWLMSYPVPEAVAFLRQLHARTGCVLADVSSQEVVSVEDLNPMTH